MRQGANGRGRWRPVGGGRARSPRSRLATRRHRFEETKGPMAGARKDPRSRGSGDSGDTPSGERAGNDGAGTVASGTVWQTHEVLAAMNDTDFASAVQRAVTSHRKIFVHQERKWAAVRLRENLHARARRGTRQAGPQAPPAARARGSPRSPRPPASRARAFPRATRLPVFGRGEAVPQGQARARRSGRARRGAAVGASRGAASRGQRAAVHLVPVLRGHERAPARRGAPAASVRRPGGRDARGERRGGRGVRRVGRRRGNARESSDADDGEHL